MMGLGFRESSASSSSSNLSPLAPPFTVDRSSYNNPSPLPHFDDGSYGLPFTSSWPHTHPSTARQDFVGDSIRTATVPCADDQGYTSSQPISPPATHNWSDLNPRSEPGRTHWSAVNTSPNPATSLFSCNVTEAKPFYPPYASPVTSINVPRNRSYDLLSSSDLVIEEELSRVDYTRSLSGLEYNPRWEDIGKQGNRMEPDVSFFSREANIVDSLASKNYADVFRRENYVGPGGTDTSFSAKNHGLLPNEFSKAPAFKAFPMFSESHPLVPSFEPPEEPWNNQKPPEKRFHMFDCSDNGVSPSMTKPSPSLVIKPPATVSNYAAFDSFNPLSESFEAGRNFLASNQPGLQIGATDEHTSVAQTSAKEEMANKLSKNDQLHFEFKARTNNQDFNNPNFCSTENVTSAATSSERFDHHNPAEDSPCWKGAPASHFSLFESQSPKHSAKKLETICVNPQGSQSDHSSKVPTSELHEIGKSPNLEDDVLSSELKTRPPVGVEDHTIHSVDIDATNLATAGTNDVNILVKALHNLSELVLLHCSEDECALKEQDRKALDQIITNLDECMSRKIRQRNNGVSGGSLEKLQGYASPRGNEDVPKNRNMIQAIKKILDENLEIKEETPSQMQFYKNLWLEAEAELCVFNYKARFDRMKKEMENSNSTHVSEITCAIKKTSSPNLSPILINEADGNKISNTHVQNPPFSGVDSGTDDVEASVMARFNILKCRQESNHINLEKEDAVVMQSRGTSLIQKHVDSDWEQINEDEISWQTNKRRS